MAENSASSSETQPGMRPQLIFIVLCMSLAGFLLGMQMTTSQRSSKFVALETLEEDTGMQTMVAEKHRSQTEVGRVGRPIQKVRPFVEDARPSIASFVVPLPGAEEIYKGKYFSQYGQDKLVDSLLNHTTGGFFIESGAFNGVELSNTLFFEATRGWKGLLIEANPYLYRDIVDKSARKSHVIHACLSPTKEPNTLPFKLAGPIGGLLNFVESGQLNRIASEISRKEPWMAGEQGSGKEMNVSCWPLKSMLSALNVKRVDYWSLDVEGSEPHILEATDFDSLDIRVLTIEVNSETAEEQVKRVMSGKKNYRLHSKIHVDLVYVKDET